VIISFYTVNTPYEQEVQNLIRSCSQFNLENVIEGRPSVGSWAENCAVKPFYILEKLRELQRPILWVDADAVFLKEPSFEFLQSCDLSVRIYDFISWRDPSKVLSGTIYINYSPAALKLVERWAKNFQRRRKRDPQTWDQAVLRDLIIREKEAKILPLPIAFCKIYDLDIFFIEQKDVVIEHYQASRRYVH
jgi:hypothetical protein